MNDENLVSLATRSKRERIEIARKGQKASTQVKKEKKLWKDELVKRLNAKDWEDIMNTLINNAKNNGGRDFEILRDTMGQKPVEKQEVDNISRINIIDDTSEE